MIVFYSLSGPFGGFGTSGSPDNNATSYSFSTSVKGTPATSARIVVYAPGCKFQTFDIEVSATSDIDRFYDCDQISNIVLKGHFDSDKVCLGNAELNVYYLGDWILEYFGARDGMVPQIDLGKAELVSDSRGGIFQIEVPDLGADSGTKGWFDFRLHAKTWNNLAYLRPVVESNDLPGLAVKPNYPSVIEFKVQVTNDVLYGSYQCRQLNVDLTPRDR